MEIVSIILSVAGSLLGILPIFIYRFVKKDGETHIEVLSSDLTLEQRIEVQHQLERQLPRTPTAGLFSKIKPGTAVLLGFAAIVVIFGIITVIRYWEQLKAAQDTAFFGGWLFLSMAGGMFVQVLSTNYRNGKPLFDVTASQLVFPLLFSVIVFYPVWAIGASATNNAFAIYAAFLNGFFWETVVTNAKLPTAGGDAAENK